MNTIESANPKSKIDCLPPHLQTELQVRLKSGFSPVALAQWLNSHSKVRKNLAAHFDSQPFTEHDLSTEQTQASPAAGAADRDPHALTQTPDGRARATDPGNAASIITSPGASPTLQDHIDTIAARLTAAALRADSDPENPAFAAAAKMLDRTLKTLLSIERQRQQAARLDLAERRFQLQQERLRQTALQPARSKRPAPPAKAPEHARPPTPHALAPDPSEISAAAPTAPHAGSLDEASSIASAA